MAYVSGGGSSDGPPGSSGGQMPSMGQFNAQIQQQLQEALQAQQQQQQMQLLLSLVGGGGVAGGGVSAASAPQLQPQQHQLSQLSQLSSLQQLSGAQQQQQQQMLNPLGMQLGSLLGGLQNQLAINQLMPQQQIQAPAVPSQASLLSQPNLLLLYQQQLQQLQLQQQQQQQAAAAAAVVTQQQQAAAAAAHAQQASSVESHVNAQQKLMDQLLAEQHQRQREQRDSNELQLAQLQAQQSHSQQQQPAGAVGQQQQALRDRESLEDHISKLISDNEAIVQPNQMLMKRRPYHRAAGSQASIDVENISGASSSRTSPGGSQRDPRCPTQRSQSMYEPLKSAKEVFGGGAAGGEPSRVPVFERQLERRDTAGSLTSGQPVLRPQPLGTSITAGVGAAALASQLAHINNMQQQQQQQQQPSLTCSYCSLRFTNEPGLQAHELHCSKRSEVVAPPKVESPSVSSRHPLKRRLLEAAAVDVPAGLPGLAGMPQMQHLQQLIKQARVEPKEVITLDESPLSTPQLARPQAQRHPFELRPSVAAPVAVSIQTASASPASSQQQPPSMGQLTPRRAAVPPQLASPRAAGMQVGSGVSSASLLSGQSQAAAVAKKETSEDLTGRLDRPYTLVLSESCKAACGVGDKDPKKARGRNITTESFVCCNNRPQPMFVEQKARLSMYSNWQQVAINESESRLNLLYMGTCSTRPRMGEKPFWRYTVANKEHGSMRMTHSSFWGISNKMRLRQQKGEPTSPQVEYPPPSEVRANNVAGLPVEAIYMPRSCEEKGKEEPMDAEIIEIFAKKEREEREREYKFHNGMKEEVKREQAEEEQEQSKEEPMEQGEQEEKERERHEKTQTPNRALSVDVMSVKNMAVMRPKKEQIIGGFRTDEVYVYVRGRGRGRYICDRCGIRCKKPSMLKKHIRSHTDIRPYKCRECNFSFKTKGNLTKHLGSKTHRRRLAEGGTGGYDSDEDRLEIATPEMSDRDESDEEEGGPRPFEEMDPCSSDDEVDEHFPPAGEVPAVPLRKFGQETILLERAAHTPPSRWMLNEGGWSQDGDVVGLGEENGSGWPAVEMSRRYKRCLSAPPSSLTTPPREKKTHPKKKMSEDEPPASVLFVPVAQITQPQWTLGGAPAAPATQGVPAGGSGLTQSQSAHMLMALAGGGGLGMVGAATTAAGLIGIGHMGQYLAKEEHACPQCDRVFSKAGELSLHLHTHNLERAQQKQRIFQCPQTECRMPFRSRNLLQRHVEMFHSELSSQLDSPSSSSTSSLQGVPPSAASAHPQQVDPMASAQTILDLGTQLAANPRSFVCTDCNIGFRKHGILAKHLRSKTHVMKLETLKKLPEDALSLITKRDNGACLNEIDTTDCEKARTSLMAIVETIRSEQTPLGSVAQSVSQGAGLAGAGLASTAGLDTRDHLSLSTSPSVNGSPQKMLPSPSQQSNGLGGLLGGGGLSLGSGLAQSPLLSQPGLSGLTTSQLAAQLLQQMPHVLAQMGGGAGAGTNALVSLAYGMPSAAAAAAAHRDQKQVSANVWVPPKVDGGAASSPSIRAPIPAPSALSGWNPPTASRPSTASAVSTVELQPETSVRDALSPLRPATVPREGRVEQGREGPHRCTICQLVFDDYVEMQVHLNADHISMRDGKDFRCPQRHCDKVYPSRECLRLHIAAHYNNRVPPSTPDSREDDCSLPFSSSQSARASVRGGAGSGDDTRSCSPASVDALRIAEESGSSPATPLNGHASSSVPAHLPCTICGIRFSDAVRLQEHWLSHVSKRPHVCEVCDAGFTTLEALSAHAISHTSNGDSA